MTAVGEEWDVAAMLACSVPQGTEGGFIDSLRDDCGPILSRVLELVRMLTGRDLLAEVLEPITGDYQAVSAMQHGWRVLAEACSQLEQNHRRLAAELRDGWDGLGADAAVVTLLLAAERHARQAEGGRLVSDQLGHVVEVSKATAEVVVAALEFLESLAVEFATSAGLGPVGVAKAAAKAPGKVERMIRLIDRAIEAVDVLRRTVRTAIRVLSRLNVLLDGANLAVDGAGVGGHLGAGSHLDETTRAAFG